MSAQSPVDASVGGRAQRPAPRILLIEDDRQIARLVRSELEDAGYSVVFASSGEAGLQRYLEGHIHLVVLDLSLPGVDGCQVCLTIRRTDALTPILMLTARATRQDIVRGLEMGADEYVTKPFDTLEFLARVRALFRRQAVYRQQGIGGEVQPPATLGTASLQVDAFRRSAQVRAKHVVLTAKEFDLLLLFVRNPGRPFTRSELLQRIWGEGFEGFEHTVNTHINRLRSKIESDSRNPTFIETVWGVGYRFTADMSA